MFVSAALLLALTVPASASAAGFAEAPSQVVETGCVGPTDTPGEFQIGQRLAQASGTGFTRGEKLPSDQVCPQVVTRATGAAVLIRREAALTASIRDPGGTWSTPVPIFPAFSEWSWAGPQVAVSDRGDVIVASVEQTRAAGTTQTRLRVARRAAGGSFGPAEVLATSSEWIDAQLGIAANGDAFVLWWTDQSSRPPIHVPVSLATASAGGTFGAPLRLGDIPWRSSPALAVASDGRALAVIPDGRSLLVTERAPGEPFGALTPIAAATDPVGVRTSAVLGTGGPAAILSQGAQLERLELLTRATAGAFAPPVVLSTASSVNERFDPFYSSQWYYALTGLKDFIRSPTPPILTLDGRALVATELFSRRNGILRYGAGLFRAPLGGTSSERHRLFGDFVFTDRAYPLSLPDGSPALAWAEPIASQRVRLHLATEGATPRPDPTPPRVQVRAPRIRVLGLDRSLKLPVTCSGPCEVRAQVVGAPEDTTLRLERAGRGTLALYNRARRPFVPLRPGTVRIRVDYGSLNSQHPRSRTLTLRLKRPPDPAVAHAIGLRAVRRGDTIRVTWRTDRPTTRSGSGYTVFWVAGSATRTWTGEPGDVRAKATKRGGSAFAVTLTRNAGEIRFVTLRANRAENPTRDEPITVEVR